MTGRHYKAAEQMLLSLSETFGNVSELQAVGHAVLALVERHPAEAAVAAVMALHTDSHMAGWCAECGNDTPLDECNTRLAIAAALDKL